MISFREIADKIRRKISPTLADEFTNQMLDFVVSRKFRGLEYFEPRDPGYHVSGIPKICAIKVVLRKFHELMTGTKLEFDEVEFRDDEIQPDEAHPSIEFQYEIGTAIHEAYQNKIFGPAGMLLGYWYCASCQELLGPFQMPVKCPLCDAHWREHITYRETKISLDIHGITFLGNVDGVWPSRLLDTEAVVEFKSLSSSRYKTLTKPEFTHVIQVHPYMKALDMRYAVIVYVDRGQPCDWSFTNGLKATGLRQKVFVVEFNDELWERQEGVIKEYVEALEYVSSLTKESISSDEAIDEVLGKAFDYTPVCDVKSCVVAQNCPVSKICFAGCE